MQTVGGKAGHRAKDHLLVDVAGTVGGVRAVQILLGYAKIDSRGHCLRVDGENVFKSAVRTELESTHVRPIRDHGASPETAIR